MTKGNDSWHTMLQEAMEDRGEDFSTVVCTLTEDQLKRKFYAGFGETEGKPFTAWGKDWVYFPVCFDGAEWVGSAPRNPCDIATDHQGGGG